MKFDFITKFFENKGKKTSFELAIKIQKLSYRLLGENCSEIPETSSLKDILENTYGILEKLEKKLEEDRKKKIIDFGRNSGFITAQTSLSINKECNTSGSTNKGWAESSTKVPAREEKKD